MIRNQVRNISGMSLVELVIVLGIGSVIAIVSVEYSKKLAHVQRNIVTMTDVASMNAEFINRTNVTSDCSALFPALPVAGFNAAAATGAGMPITIQLGNRNLTDGAIIDSHMRVVSARFQMPNPGSILSSYTTAGISTYIGVIRLRLQKTMITDGGTAMADQSFGPIALRVNSANQIEQCVSLQSPEYLCITSLSNTNIWNLGTNTCAAPAPCPAQVLSWTVGASTCNANFPSIPPSSLSPTSTDSTPPTLGSAAFTCNPAGAWSVTPEVGATCSTTCPAQLLSWTVGASTCNANFPLTFASTISPPTSDSTLPTLGDAAFNCDATGTWNATPEAGATCSLIACPAQLLSWTVGASTCNANFPLTFASTISSPTSDSTLPTLGSAAFSCDTTGTWSVTPEVGATCSTTCPAQLLSWTVGASTCNANFPLTFASSISPPTSDSTSPTLGDAAFACDATGTWNGTPQPGATCTTSACPAQSLSWTVGAATCSANFAATSAGSISPPTSDSTSPTLGDAAFACDATGTWNGTPQPGSTCSSSACPTQSLSWTVGVNTCTANFVAQTPSTDSPLTFDIVTPTLGSAIFACDSTGTWAATPNAGATCTAFGGSCPAQNMSWTVGADTCTANFAAQAPSTDSPLTSDIVAPTLGSAIFACDSTGTWAATPTTATCVNTLPVVTSRCMYGHFFPMLGVTRFNPTPPGSSIAWRCYNPSPPSGSTNLTCVGAETPICMTNDPGPPYFASNIDWQYASCTAVVAAGYELTRPRPASDCGAAPAVDCVAGATLNWTVGAQSCTATAPATSHLANASVTDSSAPTTGSASFTCNNGSWSTSPLAGATCNAPAAPCYNGYRYNIDWGFVPNYFRSNVTAGTYGSNTSHIRVHSNITNNGVTQTISSSCTVTVSGCSNSNTYNVGGTNFTIGVQYIPYPGSSFGNTFPDPGVTTQCP